MNVTSVQCFAFARYMILENIMLYLSTITNRVIFIILNQVDGGGVQAEVVEADVGASNGVIHSINRVKCSFQETNLY